MKNIVWYKVGKVRAHEKRRHHASTLGQQNDLQEHTTSPIIVTFSPPTG